MKNKIIIIVLILAALLIAGYMIGMTDSSDSADTAVNNQENSTAADNNKDNIQAENVNVPLDTVNSETEKKLKEYRQSAGNEKLSRLYIVKCAACHGKDGKGIIGLPITGKSYDYNYNALLKYKNGQVKNSLMKGLLENTPDEEIKALAEEISRFE